MRLRTLRNSLLLLLPVLFVAVFLFISLRTGYQSRLGASGNMLTGWKLEDAERELASLAEEFPESLDVRRLYAECLLKRGQLRESVTEYRFLVGADTTHGLSHKVSLATAFFFLGQLDSSAFHAETVLAEAQERKDTALLAQGHHLLGRIAFNRASYPSALALQRRSLAFARAVGSAQSEADALRQIGVLYWYSGNADSAYHSFYEPALQLYRQVNDRIGEATTLNNIGLATGNPGSCLQAFAIRKQIGDQIGLADSYYFVSSPVGGARWNDRAYAFRLKSLRLSERIGYAWGKDVAARAVDQMVFSAYDSLSFGHAAAETTATVGEAEIFRLQARSVDLMRRRHVDESIRLRERVVFLCDSMAYGPGLGMALAQYADALIMGGRYKEAERAIARLRSAWNNASPAPDLLLAQMQHASGDYAAASLILTRLTEYYDQAYRDNLKEHSLNAAIEQASILYTRFAIYEKLIECLSRMGETSSLFSVMEMFRSITTMHGEGTEQWESVQQPYNAAVEAIEIGDTSVAPLVKEFAEAYERSQGARSAAQDASTIIDQMERAELSAIQRSMGPDEVVLEYFIGKEHAYVLVVRGDSCTHVRLTTPVRDINSSAVTFRALILRGQKQPGDSLWKGPAAFLYSSLLEPLGPALREGDHILVSPHGSLHGVPFAPLLDAAGRSIIERFRISIIRSAGDIVRKQTRHHEATALAVVPDRVSLKFAEKEVMSIPQGLYANRTLLMDEQATTTGFLERARDADLIHIAAHGMVNRALPLFSQLQMWDGPLELQRIIGARFGARLVLVSACESGYGVGMLGDVSSGHVIVSFPHAFLAAGASTVLAPLWIIEDQATAYLIGSFYSNLEAHGSQDRQTPRGTYPLALALAQRQASRERLKSHPFYWAGFQILGLVNR